MDAFSRQDLTHALRAAADGHSARLPAFTAARDLCRHTEQTLAARHKARARCRCFGHPARNGRPDPFIPEAASLHDDLLAATRDLRNRARLRPRVTVVQGSEPDGSLQEALSAQQRLYDAIGNYLEQLLQPLEPHISPDAVRAFILETRREVDDLAACDPVGEGYVDVFTITEAGNKSVSIEIEVRLGAFQP